MIEVTVYCRNQVYVGLKASGHAGYAEAGEDIFCAAASALIINTVNSIEQLTQNEIADEAADDGLVSCSFPGGLDEDGALLIDSLLLGLRQMEESRDVKSNKQYVKVICEEV